MEEMACLFCDRRNQPVVIAENGFLGRKCDVCGLIYISPRPSVEDIRNLYSHEQAVRDADVQLGFDNVNRLHARATLRRIKQYTSSGSLLELGSGGGFFVAEARAQGFDPFAVELNPIEAKWINEEHRIPCECSPLSGSSFGGRNFDIVYHRDVLSHLPNPIATFAEINRALKPGGLHVFETGNIADVDARYYKYFSQFSYPDHLFFFGERSITNLLGRTGFRASKIRRNPIFLQLLIQKALWGVKEHLKDRSTGAVLSSGSSVKKNGTTMKKSLRKLYRYVSFVLIACGRILPRASRPLKLIVFARKSAEPCST